MAKNNSTFKSLVFSHSGVLLPFISPTGLTEVKKKKKATKQYKLNRQCRDGLHRRNAGRRRRNVFTCKAL